MEPSEPGLPLVPLQKQVKSLSMMPENAPYVGSSLGILEQSCVLNTFFVPWSDTDTSTFIEKEDWGKAEIEMQRLLP